MLEKVKGLAQTAAQMTAQQGALASYRYEVAALDTLDTLAAELEKMAADGWQPILAFQEVSGANRYVTIFRKPSEVQKAKEA